jgi:hypothetical protein
LPQDQLRTLADIVGSRLPLRRGGESKVENTKRQSFDFGAATSIAEACALQSQHGSTREMLAPRISDTPFQQLERLSLPEFDATSGVAS